MIQLRRLLGGPVVGGSDLPPLVIGCATTTDCDLVCLTLTRTANAGCTGTAATRETPHSHGQTQAACDLVFPLEWEAASPEVVP